MLKGQANHDEAFKSLSEAIRLKPDDANSHAELGLFLKSQGKLDEAIAECREAIRICPTYAEAHCNLAGILRRQGKFAESLAVYRTGHELGTKQPDGNYETSRPTPPSRSLAKWSRYPSR
jgi:tetratricopeptide (TPR) repeat protein